jgi:hypothetical protein
VRPPRTRHLVPATWGIELLGLLFDFLFSYYLLGPKPLKTWQWIAAAVCFGIVNSALVSFGRYYLLSGSDSPADAVGSFVVGCILHPLVCLSLTAWRRRQISKWDVEAGKG